MAEASPAPEPQPGPESQPQPTRGAGAPDTRDPPGDVGGAGESGGVQPGTGPTQANNFDTLHADTVNFNTIQNQLDPLYENRTSLLYFNCKHGTDVSERWEEECDHGFRGSDAEADVLLGHLEQRRVLLLGGPPGAGRVTAAIYLGRRLRAAAADPRPTLLVQSLGRQVRLDLRQIASRDPELKGRMVIFRDLLGRVERAEHSAWSKMAEQLRERGAYVVFIVDEGGGASDGLSPTYGYARALTPHPPELLEAELDASLEELERRGTHAGELLAALRSERAWLLKTFAFVPQMLDFVSLYADLKQPDLAPEEAWRRFHDSGARLLRDRDGDLDGWAAVLALALAQSAPDARGARWVDFDGLHRRLSGWLRADVERRAAGEGEEDEEPTAATPPRFQDAPLLDAAHAETYTDHATLACGVRFRDGVAPEPVWRALLKHHRRALLTVLPGLRQLAQAGGELSVPAAQVIGRLGEMDPDRITLPLATRWLRSADTRRQRVLGPMFEGVLGSASKPYREHCLGRLAAMRHGADGERMAALLAAYSWIGDHDLDEALRVMGSIAEERLAPMIADAQRVERLAGQVRSRLHDASTVQKRAALRRIDVRLRDIAAAVYRDQATTFVALQMSLNSLCATRGTLPVVAGLHRWVGTGGWKMGVLVALLFFNEDGIADTLRQSRGDVEGGCNPLVERLAEGSHEVRRMAEFLRDLFESLATPFLVKTELARDIVESLGEHLTDWIRDALPGPSQTAAMHRLLETMARMPALHDMVDDLLHSSSFGEDEPRLRAFAQTIQV